MLADLTAVFESTSARLFTTIRSLMRILFLSKARYMSKDLVRERYGRFYHLPKALAASGHEVHLLTLYYREAHGPSAAELAAACDHGLNVTAHGYLSLLSGQYLRSCLRSCREWRPQVLITGSDVLHLALGAELSRRTGLPFVADLYDQFLAYPSGRWPGVARLYHHSLRAASGIACVSEVLAKWVRKQVPDTHIEVVGNAVECLFLSEAVPSKADARQALGLPARARLIGTAGSLTKNRDIETLYEAYRLLRVELSDQNLGLVLAGPRPDRCPVPELPGLIDLGQLPSAQVPTLLAALDLGLVINGNSQFARNCFPQKYFEMRALGLPVVAAGIGDILSYGPEQNTWHYRPGDAAALTLAIQTALDSADPGRVTVVPAWKDQATKLARLIDTCTR